MLDVPAFASYYKLDNLVTIVDMNRLGQTQQTMLGHDADAMAKRFESFGCHTVVVDGSNVVELLNAYNTARLEIHLEKINGRRNIFLIIFILIIQNL